MMYLLRSSFHTHKEETHICKCMQKRSQQLYTRTFFLTLSKCLKSSRAEQLQNQIYNFPSSKPKEAGNSLKGLSDKVEYFSSF